MTEMSHPSSLVSTIRSMPTALYVLGAATLVSRSGGFLAIFGSIYLTSLSISQGQVVAVLTAVGVFGMGGSLIGGRLADRYSPKAVLLTASLTNSVALGALATDPGPAVSVVIMIIAATMTQAFVPPAAAMVGAMAPDLAAKTPYFAFFRLFLNLGSTASPLVATLLGESEFQLLFAYSGLANIAAFVVLLAGLRTPVVSAGNRQERQGARTGLPMGRKRGVLALGLFGLLAVTAAIYAQYQSTLPLQIRATHGDLVLYSLLIIINSLLVIAGELPLSALTRRYPVHIPLAAGVSVMTCGLVLGGLFSDATGVLVVGAVMFTVGEMAFAPVANTAATMLAPQGQEATYQGYLSSAQALGFALGPAAGVALYFRMDGGFWLLILCMGLACAVVLFTTLHRRPSGLSTDVKDSVTQAVAKTRDE